MISKSCFFMVTVVALILAATLWFHAATLGGDVPPSSSGSSREPASQTPVPLHPTACPTIRYEVVTNVDASRVNVGDTFVLHSSASGFAGLAQTRLYVTYRVAVVPELEVIDPLPMIEVLPNSTGSSLGSAEFTLRALRPGTITLHTEVYGDALFYDTLCTPGTTFKLVHSEPVRVSIAP